MCGSATYSAPSDGKGLDTDINGGHVHTEVSHTHTGVAHTHSISGAASTGGSAKKYVSAFFSRKKASEVGHTEGPTSSAGATITYQNTTVTIDSGDQHPKNRKLIVIKPDDVGQDVPAGAIVLSRLDTHSNFTKKLWADSFLLGADTAADATTAEGGNTNHTSPPHSHTSDPHTHVPALVNSSGVFVAAGFTQSFKQQNHHRIGGASTSTNDVQNTAINLNDASTIPAWCKLIAHVADSTQAMQTGMIVMFVDAFGNIPTDYSAYTPAYDRQIQLTETLGEVGNTGGSDTHTHVVDPHVHTHAGMHTHVEQIVNLNPGVSSTIPVTGSNFAHLQTDVHNHVWTISDVMPIVGITVVVLDTVDGRYKWRTVLWIEFTEPTVTGNPHYHYQKMKKRRAA